MADLIAQETALVLIDLQVRIVGTQTEPRNGADVVRACMRLADAVRHHGGLVVIVQAQRPQPEQPPGSELVGELLPHEGDLLITKRTWGAFAATGLHERLQERGITTVALGGIATNMGVESTGRAAADLGYRIFFVEDAMASLSAEMHAFAIEKIFPLLGTVCSTDEFLAQL
jgi:nicotinamidase-related amidase